MATPTTTPTLIEAALPAAEEERRQRQVEKNRAAIALLQSWREEDDPEAIQDQRETWEILRKALGEDRSSYRKLFP